MYFTVDGQEVYTATGAEPHRPGKPFITFIHGAGCDHTEWVLFARFFSRNGFNVLSPDLPGHGKSTVAPLTSVEQLAQWVLALLDAAKVETTMLVGHSLGSLIALETAAKNPQYISHLVMLGTTVPMLVSDALLNAARDRSQAAVDIVMQFGHAFSSQLGHNPVAGISAMNHRMRILERGLPTNLFEDLNACHTYLGGLEAARSLQMPVMLLLGDQDRMTPPHSTQALIAALKAPDVRMIPNCGHMLMSEQPEAVHQALVAAAMGR